MCVPFMIYRCKSKPLCDFMAIDLKIALITDLRQQTALYLHIYNIFYIYKVPYLDDTNVCACAPTHGPNYVFVYFTPWKSYEKIDIMDCTQQLEQALRAYVWLC